MVQFVSLNTIVTDLLNVIRSSNISASETISKRQIEDWVHQYRSVLLKRDLDKGKKPNPDYIQEIGNIKLERSDMSGDDLTSLGMESGYYLYRTELEIPKTIDLNFTSGFTYIGSPLGYEIQLIPEGRSKWQKYKKYTQFSKLCFLRSGRLYIINSEAMDFVTIRGIFEIPSEVERFINPITNQPYFDINSKYPIPISMLPDLKNLIISKELNIEVSAPTDKTNDSTHNPQ